MATRKPRRITIECVTPELDAGRFPVKRIVGDSIAVAADIFRDGHDELAARVLYKKDGSARWESADMSYDNDSDRWYAEFIAKEIGRWTYTVEAWTDRFATWRSGLKKKVDAGVEVKLELIEGAQLVKSAARGVKDSAIRASLIQTAKILADEERATPEQKVARAFDGDLVVLMRQYYKPDDLTRYDRELSVWVDRERARFASWYEFFPRSAARHPERSEGPATHGTFADAAKDLSRIVQLGFDVVYLPPIHPIGRTFRKGKNNSLTPESDDVGSPWAIGNEHGGHTAIEPALGNFKDFARFLAEAKRLGMEVALDYALQCSPDHPWVKEHPDWFHIRPDGTIAYAENPPKKYQDIYPLNFWCDDRTGLWNACRDVILFWVERGVKIFRVDNPHTKAFAFWEWMIADVQSKHPDVIFFAEAFTRPKKMKELAKLGFTMSYTYFTWKNSSWELREFIEEFFLGPASEYYRGNLFANTPDILHEYLVRGGRNAFRIRATLAATLSPLYGIYSGFELGENVPVKPGSEEYLDSEKYQLKPRDWNAEGNINADLVRLNRIRREHPVLQELGNIAFCRCDNPAMVSFLRGRRAQGAGRRESLRSGVHPERTEGSSVLVVATTDPFTPQETTVHVPLARLGFRDDEQYTVRDLLTGARYTWRGERNYVRLDPATEVAHILLIEGD